MSDEPLLAAIGVSRHFATRRGGLFTRAGTMTAVDDVSVAIRPGELVAVVGESGSGKSTLGRMMLGLTPPSLGSISWRGQDVATLKGLEQRRFRREVQVVFQDTGTSLNPRHRIGETVAMPLRWNLGLSARVAQERADGLLDRVGLAPASFRHRLPHELSGGQRQRVGLARALASEPSVIIADEPVSALDVSVRAQVLALMRDLKNERGLAYLFITHDLGVVRAIADRVLVMLGGRIVEEGPAARLMASPSHAYTRALLAATPIPDPSRRGRRAAAIAEG